MKRLVFLILILSTISCREKDPVVIAREVIQQKGVVFSEQEFINSILYDDKELVNLFLTAGISPDAEGDVRSFLLEHDFKVNRKEIIIPALFVAELIGSDDIYSILRQAGASRVKASLAKRKLKAESSNKPIVIERLKSRVRNDEDKRFIERLRQKTKEHQSVYDSQMKRLQDSLNQLK